MIDIKAKEIEILEGLKDFQRATVDRCIEVFRSGQNRILVADEVGLGKTLVAKGVVARLASWYKEEKTEKLFKVVYICANQSIASQNIQKLYSGATVDGVSDTRLSMQHLKIFEQENDDKVLARYVQLIPLTPSTSLNITNGCGSIEERALIFALLKRMTCFVDVLPYLETMMIYGANVSWNDWGRDVYERRVVECNNKCGNYISCMLEELNKRVPQELVDEIHNRCKVIKENNNGYTRGNYNVIYKLRQIFAGISIDYLKPDLVIMDEFQRFRELINADESTESGMLTNRFLKNGDVKTLLVSATPYKLYETLEEMSINGLDEHYIEFLEVMNFLFSDEEKRRNFREVWHNFSVSLREIFDENLTIIEIKNKAESAMYEGVCRTERMLVDQECAILDDSGAKNPISITEKDIFSYVEADTLLRAVGHKIGVPSDYVKSSPYLLSFMENYQLKKQLKKFFKINREEIRKAHKPHLWLDKAAIKSYRELPLNNARLKKLYEIAFEKRAERLLWIPPSKPYYELGGVFKNNNHYSKVLVFSKWEMVPRMIASMLSYEAERLTVGKLYNNESDKRGKDYFAKSRFPLRRLRFNQEGSQPLFTLIYPAVVLSDLYDPIACMGKSIKEIRKEISAELKVRLEDLKRYVDNTLGNKPDTRWYYVGPMLLDIGTECIEGYFEQDQPEEKMHREKLDEFYRYYKNAEILKLGRMPSDLADVLTNMSIASPAVCALRIFKDTVLASRFAKEMINIFNTPEAISTIDMLYGKTSDDAYYKNVLKYAVDGNLQAVLDEYAHMIDEDDNNRRCEKMADAIKIHTASYPVDTYASFKSEIEGNNDRKISIRSHFAAGFYNAAVDSKTVQRKDSLRNAFNSPFRPFVLATTSIGQEGLDFHVYCRKIMHWNLPANPIDLEQREGRINRYKCHAIRQNIAVKYGDIEFHQDVWKEMFDAALENEKGNNPELVPFWCLPGGGIVKIERIVPMYPMSKDGASYERLMKILSLYRLTLGHARQEELLEYLFNNFEDAKMLKNLFINLSPYIRQRQKNNI
ncbi:MAG: DEAD/DEAH box helicase family protein [Acidaminococcaceae bacterium]